MSAYEVNKLCWRAVHDPAFRAAPKRDPEARARCLKCEPHGDPCRPLLSTASLQGPVISPDDKQKFLYYRFTYVPVTPLSTGNLKLR